MSSNWRRSRMNVGPSACQGDALPLSCSHALKNLAVGFRLPNGNASWEDWNSPNAKLKVLEKVWCLGSRPGVRTVVPDRKKEGCGDAMNLGERRTCTKICLKCQISFPQNSWRTEPDCSSLCSNLPLCIVVQLTTFTAIMHTQIFMLSA